MIPKTLEWATDKQKNRDRGHRTAIFKSPTAIGLDWILHTSGPKSGNSQRHPLHLLFQVPHEDQAVELLHF